MARCIRLARRHALLVPNVVEDRAAVTSAVPRAAQLTVAELDDRDYGARQQPDASPSAVG
jgi:hypothetical protein